MRCQMCGAPLASEPQLTPLPPLPAASNHEAPPALGGGPQGANPVSPLVEQAARFRAEREARAPSRALQFLLIGMPLAALFAVAPFVQFMGWFLSSLFHESGHCVAGWLMGQPTIPKISLEGHAMASAGEPMWVVRIAVVAGLVSLARMRWSGRPLAIALGALGIAYPLLLFTALGDVLFLAGGHLGELAMAAVCLWRAATEDACHHDGERAAYAMLGWYLIGDNVKLSFGLAFSESARQAYAANGSFGLTNDYIRIATEHLGTGVGTVGLISGMAALVVALAAITAGLKHVVRG